MISVPVFLIYCILAIVSFYIINWIGGHSFDIGYMQLSLYYRVDEAPIFNLLFRITAPVVIIIVCAAVFYSLNVTQLTKQIWIVVPLIFIFRALFNIILGRTRLLNWLYYAIITILSSSLAYLTYQYLIFNREFLFPDMHTFGNELWLIVVLFIYGTANNIRTDAGGAEKRKESYILKEFTTLRRKYSNEIEKADVPLSIQVLTYAILIVENFNRPKLVRQLEKIYYFMRRTRSGTFGVMQCGAHGPLTDVESVKSGMRLLIGTYEKVKKYSAGKGPAYSSGDTREHIILERVAWLYNNSTDYSTEAMALYDVLMNQIFSPPKPRDPRERFNAFSYIQRSE